jgi:predicted RNA binding protein YcfA (HicA-like mRNA interferase family)
MRYRPIGREGSHVKLRYEHPETDEVRVVSVPLTDSDQISQDTYRSIADQCGAEDFDAWCRWIDEHRWPRRGSRAHYRSVDRSAS